MIGTSFLLAASSLLAVTYSAPISQRSNAAAPRSLVARGSYAIFGGDGTETAGWPKEADFMKFDDAWELNLPIIKASCGQFNVPDNSEQEILDIYDGIVAASKTSGVATEFIFAVMMQESKGCVRAPTTNWGVRNPGLMQDHDGVHTCNEGSVQTPCPKEQIFGMIMDGANGTPQGDGLKQVLAQAGTNDASKYYRAARIYNSGRVDGSNNLGAGGATHCYASDIANRLIGWANDKHHCKESTIGSLSSSEGFQSAQGGQNNGNNSPAPTATTSPSAPVSSPTANVPVAIWNPDNEDSEDLPLNQEEEQQGKQPVEQPSKTQTETNPSAPKAPGAASSCTSWYTIKDNEWCQKIESSLSVTEGTLRKLNSGLTSDCLNLWKGYAYCVAA